MSCTEKPAITSLSLSKFLASLGGDKIEVARTLRSKGVKGAKQLSHSCPIKHLIDQTFSNTTNIYVYRSTVNERSPWGTEIARNPLPVAQFIEAFDKGEYPELEG